VRCPQCQTVLSVPSTLVPTQLPIAAPAPFESPLISDINDSPFTRSPDLEPASPSTPPPPVNFVDLGSGASSSGEADPSYRDISDPVYAVPEKGLKVYVHKRRSDENQPRMELPDWEKDPNSIPTAEAIDSSSPISTSAVSLEIRPDGQIIETRRRLHKKQNFTGIQAAFDWIVRFFRWTGITLGTTLLLGTLLIGFIVLQRKYAPPASAPLPDPYPVRNYATLDEGLSAHEVVKAFLEANGVEEKLKHVRYPELLRPIMTEYYRTHSAAPVTSQIDRSIEDLHGPLVDRIVIGEKAFIKVSRLLQNSENRIFILEPTTNGLKLDWETSVNYEPMPYQQFVTQRPIQPVPFRVFVQRHDYYNAPFQNPAKWLCFLLTYPTNPDFHLYGYVERDSFTGKRLVELLSNPAYEQATISGNWQDYAVMGDLIGKSMILSLSFPHPTPSDLKQVNIMNIINEEWLADAPISVSQSK
jgi:hypothetical protein